MRRLYLAATVLFWLVVGVYWIAGRSPSPPGEDRVRSSDRRITDAELARHSRADDCWMAIRGQVHDVSAYLPEHPSRPSVVLPWCGREASEAYATKGKGRPHSPSTDALLASYRIGIYAGAPR